LLVIQAPNGAQLFKSLDNISKEPRLQITAPLGGKIEMELISLEENSDIP